MYENYIKRFLDIVLSLLFLILLSPFFLLTTIVTYFELGKPIIFKQVREGKGKKYFTIYKFRTMDFNEDAPRNERMTKITSFFDRCKLNELPQLINVLKGDMSIVGPRPFMKDDKLPKEPFKERYYVKPGMTGLAQVKAGRFISHDRKLEYDVIYYENLSFLLDLKIFLFTPFSIFRDLRR